MSQHAAAIRSAMEVLRGSFASGHIHFPSLNHAVLAGFAIHDQPRVREYIQENIVHGLPFDPVHGKVGAPFGFFFGEHLNGLSLLDSLADRFMTIVYDNGGPGAFGIPTVPDVHEDYGAGHVLLCWAYALGEVTGSPLLTPIRGRILPTPPMFDLRGNKLPPSLRLLNDTFLQRQRRGFSPLSQAGYEEYYQTLDHIAHGDLEDVTIYRGGVFLAAQVFLEALLQAGAGPAPQLVSEPDELLSDRKRLILATMLHLKATGFDDRRSRDEIARAAEGVTANVTGYSEPLAELVARGFAASKEGRGGGSWLTAKGIERAQKL